MATIHIFNKKPVLHIANTLERTNRDVCRALAARIRLCNSDKNGYIGKGMFVNDYGRKKDGIGTITACNSKFCPSCVSKNSRQNFRTAKYILDNLVNPKWLVLTLPDSALIGLTLDKQFEIFNYFYRELYRHSNLFQNKKNRPKKIDGTLKTIEFTEDENGNARHVHYNMILDCQFLSYKDLLADVNKAFKVSCNRFGLKFQEVENLFLREVVEKVTDDETQISKIEVNRKVARYICKPQAWHILKPDELVEMVENEKKYRMFATTGSCAVLARQARELDKKARERKYKNAATIYQQNLIVPNPTITTPTTATATPTPATAPTVPAVVTPKQPRKPRKKSWRYRIVNKLITLADYKKELDETFLMMSEFRMVQLQEKYYWVTDFRTLDGIPFSYWLHHHKKAKKRRDSDARRSKRAVYEPSKIGALFPDKTVIKPSSLPVVVGGFIGNRKPQPAFVCSF